MNTILIYNNVLKYVDVKIWAQDTDMPPIVDQNHEVSPSPVPPQKNNLYLGLQPLLKECRIRWRSFLREKSASHFAPV